MTDISRRNPRRKTVQSVTAPFSMMVSGVGSAGGAARTRRARAGWTYSLRVTLPAWGPLGPSTISNSTA